ncbi:MAG: SAVED domain-containing protein [Bacteroidales bacterium]|nr:SAVED domain-containing protein [Bacteroidales bacterium]
MKYRWLHISDLHSLCGIKTEIMRMALLSEIQENIPFSFILITGDLSDKNQGYSEAKELILNIVQILSLSQDKIYIVPGNHDVNRNVPPDRVDKCKELWKFNDLIDNEEIMKELIKGQDDFFLSYKEIINKDYPKNTIHFYQKFDNNLAIIHLNTAWMCCDSDNESGKLHLGLKKLSKLFSDNPELNSTPIKIAIGHHRLEDFNEIVRNNFRTLLNEYDIDLYLGGHCHESNVVYDPTISVEFCSCRQARAEDINFPAGFIIGNIDTETDQSYFEFYSWNTTLSKWTYDYTVNPAKHGKYYLNHSKYKKDSSRKIIVDLKLMGGKLNIVEISNKFPSLTLSEIYKTSLVNVRPESTDEWICCFDSIHGLFNQVVQNSQQDIHVFPLAQIPLLVYFGFLIQNNSSNISIYQYYENANAWILDEKSDDYEINEQKSLQNNRILAVSVSISAAVQESDIKSSLKDKFDLIAFSINEPTLSKLNYKKDVENVKNIIKNHLDKLHNNYEEIHLFLAAPAGLCIEIGRIIRKDMYPDTYVYQYNRRSELKYAQIANLMELKYGN